MKKWRAEKLMLNVARKVCVVPHKWYLYRCPICGTDGAYVKKNTYGDMETGCLVCNVSIVESRQGYA